MKRTSDFKRHNVNRIDCLDGTILLESNDQIDPIASNTGEWLDHWASMTGRANVSGGKKRGRLA